MYSVTLLNGYPYFSYESFRFVKYRVFAFSYEGSSASVKSIIPGSYGGDFLAVAPYSSEGSLRFGERFYFRLQY
jgi:hypothetical protein